MHLNTHTNKHAKISSKTTENKSKISLKSSNLYPWPLDQSVKSTKLSIMAGKSPSKSGTPALINISKEMLIFSSSSPNFFH
jgi:hypothetical protein